MKDIEAIARNAHAGQQDKAGRDYFLAHISPVAFGAALFGAKVEAAAWLHDIFEDTSITSELLLKWGVEREVVEAVEAVTRRSEEDYGKFILRAAAHQTGKLVKLVDNAWNITSNASLARTQPDLAAKMLTERYLPARQRLLEATGFSESSPEVQDLQRILDKQLAQLEKALLPPLHVVAAVVQHEGKILACRRKLHKSAGGRWEFPGGKVEAGESESEALVREIHEELGIGILPLHELDTTETLVNGRTIRLTCIAASLTDVFPTQSTDHDRLEWVEPIWLKQFEWADPDLPAVRLLMEQYGLASE